MSAAKSFIPAWQGIHHVALTTPNLDETITFYHGMLGLEFTGIAPASDMHGRHTVFLTGGEHLGLHFFELQDAQIFTPPDFPSGKMPWFPGALHHIALAIPDEAAALRLRQHLDAHNVKRSDIMDQGSTWNLIFMDNNGIMLEANWPKP